MPQIRLVLSAACQGFPCSLDLCQNLDPVRFPAVRLRLVIAGRHVRRDGSRQLRHATEASGPDALLRDVGEETLHEVHPGTRGGGEMHVEPGAPLQPCLHLGLLVRGVIVCNQMDIQVLGRLAVELLEEAQPLYMRVLLLGPVDQFPVQVVQRGEQRDRAVPDVIVRLGADVPLAQREAGLRAFQGLALRFLVAAEHQGLLGRVEVQANHIPELDLELGIVGEFESAFEVGLEVLAAPDPGHAAVREAEMGGQSARAPASPAGRSLAGGFDDALDHGGGQGGLAAAAGPVPQARKALPFKALRPFADAGQTDLQVLGNILECPAFGAQEDNPRAQAIALGGGRGADTLLEDLFFFGGEFWNGDGTGHR